MQMQHHVEQMQDRWLGSRIGKILMFNMNGQ